VEDDRRTKRWLTTEEAAARMRVGVKTVYREVRAGRLRAARIGGRRSLRFTADWVDDCLAATVAERPANS
jgi:excisionase family DNA binding protein